MKTKIDTFELCIVGRIKHINNEQKKRKKNFAENSVLNEFTTLLFFVLNYKNTLF